MPGRQPVVHPVDQVYQYDGGLAGFYSCVHASVYRRQLPLDIQAQDCAPESLLPVTWIETDLQQAGKVRHALSDKVSPQAQELVETVFLSCLEHKELAMLRFMLLAFGQGPTVMDMLQHPDVSRLLKAQRHLGGEAHLLKGFIRFSDYGGQLVATIKPKNFVLPFLAEHFAQRLSGEDYLIYDKTHRAALIKTGGEQQLVKMGDLQLREPDSDEERYRALWKRFYHTIAIKARENPRCRMTHMPKRYWSEMTEMQELL